MKFVRANWGMLNLMLLYAAVGKAFTALFSDWNWAVAFFCGLIVASAIGFWHTREAQRSLSLLLG